MSIDRQVARYLCDLADAINDVKCNVDWGQFYVTEVHIGFEGEDTKFRVVMNEHMDYDIEEVE